MSKKRFVEFYLAAMMKAATDGRVIRLAYTYNPATKGMAAQELVAVTFSTGSVVPTDVNGKDLLQIAKAVLEVGELVK